MDYLLKPGTIENVIFLTIDLIITYVIIQGLIQWRYRKPRKIIMLSAFEPIRGLMSSYFECFAAMNAALNTHPSPTDDSVDDETIIFSRGNIITDTDKRKRLAEKFRQENSERMIKSFFDRSEDALLQLIKDVDNYQNQINSMLGELSHMGSVPPKVIKTAYEIKLLSKNMLLGLNYILHDLFPFSTPDSFSMHTEFHGINFDKLIQKFDGLLNMSGAHTVSSRKIIQAWEKMAEKFNTAKQQELLLGIKGLMEKAKS